MLKASEICNIIKTCASNSVSEITLHGIAIKFHARRNEHAETLGPVSDFTNEVSEISPEDKVEADQFDRAQLLEAEEAQMLIDDPFSFEKLQISQDVERNRELNEKAQH